jgi:hypothetical protein
MMSDLSKRIIPKRLEEDLNAKQNFKPKVRDYRLTVKKVMEYNSERAMFDELIGPIVPKWRKDNDINANISKSSSDETYLNDSSIESRNENTVENDHHPNLHSNDNKFTTTLLKRLTDQEIELKNLHKQLHEKMKLILSLENENHNLKQQNGDKNFLLNEIEQLQEENNHLHHKINDMENFLNDYGLVWVGYEGEHYSTNDHITLNKNDNHDQDDIDNNFQFDHKIFIQKINELNQLIYNEPTQVMIKNKIGSIIHPSEKIKTIKIISYQNGLMINNGPFRRKQSVTYRHFIQDILDGFFPTEFKNDYPDGVLFDFHDQFHNVYEENSETKPKLNPNQFLAKLPKTVIKNGNIFDIRQNIAEKIGVSLPAIKQASDITLESSPTLDCHSQSSLIPNPPIIPNSKSNHHLNKVKKLNLVSLYSHSLTEYNDTEQIKVKIRWFDGEIFEIYLNPNDRVRVIYSVIQDYLLSHNMPILEFQLRTIWPSRVVELSETLEEAELLQDGALRAYKK